MQDLSDEEWVKLGLTELQITRMRLIQAGMVTEEVIQAKVAALDKVLFWNEHAGFFWLSIADHEYGPYTREQLVALCDQPVGIEDELREHLAGLEPGDELFKRLFGA